MSELTVQCITKHYKKGSSQEVAALNEISFDVEKGEILAVLGLNGAGKTTLVKILSGLIAPDVGMVELGGRKFEERSAYLKQVGAVFEGNRNVYWRLSAFENLEYFGVLRGLSLRRARERSDAMLELFGLTDKRDTIAAHLSRGMQQRLAIAISLVHEPSMVILDEPTLGVDVQNVLKIIQTLKTLSRQGVTVILTSHQFDVVKMLATRIALLVNGRMVAIEDRGVFMNRSGKRDYVLNLHEHLDEGRRVKLRDFGVDVDAAAEAKVREIVFEAERLYEVMGVLCPLRIHSLTRGEEDFTNIFMDRVEEHGNA